MPPKTLQPVAGKMKKSKSTSSVPTTAAELSTAGAEGQTPPSEDKLKMKEVIAACRVAISHQQSNEDPEVAQAFRVLQRFADLKEKEAESAIGYSRVTRAMLNDLSIKTGFLCLDKSTANEHAARRELKERFTEDKKYYSSGGLGKKEALASLMVANYILEALYVPQTSRVRLLLKQAAKLPLPKFSPEQTVPKSEHKADGEVLYKFHGVIDYITFLTDARRSLNVHDISEWEDVVRLSNGKLCSVEVKPGHLVHNAEHVWEASAQAVSLSAHLEGAQRYIMTDGATWRFCLFDPKEKMNYLSDLVSSQHDGDSLVLTLLEDWIWFAGESLGEFWSRQA